MNAQLKRACLSVGELAGAHERLHLATKRLLNAIKETERLTYRSAKEMYTEKGYYQAYAAAQKELAAARQSAESALSP